MSVTTLTSRPITLDPAAHSKTQRSGLLFGLAAYGWWGLVPAYFKLVAHVPAPMVLAHRIVWSVLLLAAVIVVGRHWASVRAAIGDRRVRRWLTASTLLIAINWLVFIYSVSAGKLVEASLGYFINPLFTVVLGMVFLGERLRPAQWAAACIAAGGLVYLTAARGGLPWIAIVLPISFGFYSLIRKQAPVGALAGLFIETALLTPLALVYLSWSHAQPAAESMNTPATLALLSLSGIITAVPMLCFVAAARRLPLVTLGFMHYLCPTLQFLTAVLIFGEPFGRDRAITFALIWVALGVFVVDSVRRSGIRARAMIP